MANKIEFPLNSATYLRKARFSLKEGKNKEALDFIEKAYELDSDIQINIFYAFMLARFARYEEALEIMNEKKSVYLNNENQTAFYVELLINTRNFIEAEYLIQQYKKDPIRIDDQIWDKLEEILVQERERANLEAKILREKIKSTLRELESYSHMAQVNKVEDAQILELSELQEVAQIILINPEISGTVQRYFLELLSNKGDQNEYSFQWLNQIKKVRPIELLPFAEVELVHEIIETLEGKLAKYPDLEIRVRIELMHDLLLLYPYIEEIIKDVEFWVDAYITELDFFDYAKIKRQAITEEEQDMMKWIDYLNTLAQRGQMFTD